MSQNKLGVKLKNISKWSVSEFVSGIISTIIGNSLNNYKINIQMLNINLSYIMYFLSSVCIAAAIITAIKRIKKQEEITDYFLVKKIRLGVNWNHFIVSFLSKNEIKYLHNTGKISDEDYAWILNTGFRDNHSVMNNRLQDDNFKQKPL